MTTRLLTFRTLSDEEQQNLAERIATGDRSAEKEFVSIFGPRVAAAVAQRVPDRSASPDLTQDALVAALVALRAGKLEHSHRLAAFVYGIVRNLANSHWRSEHKRPQKVALEPDMLVADPVPALESTERRRLAEQALWRLPRLEREVLGLTLRDGLDPHEIAARLGVTTETVRTRKSRALKRLTEVLRAASRSGHGEPPSG